MSDDDEPEIDPEKVRATLEDLEQLQEALRGGRACYPSDLEGIRQRLRSCLEMDDDRDGGLP